MLQELDRLLAATALFVLGHFILSSRALRAPLIEKLGEGGFRALYSLSMLGAMVWMIWSYRGAAFIEVWTPPEAGRLAALILMAFAAILVVGGLTQANPTAVGGEKLLAENGSAKAARGFSTISRHPFLCGTSLWALAHLISNGDAATMILTGGILVLSLGGMIHIDARRAASLGADWGPLLLTTSRLPFWAALTGRSKIDWRGIGLLRPLAGLALYALLLFGHQWIAGAALLSL